MTAVATLAAPWSRRLWRWRASRQGVATALVVPFCGGLVAYPIVHLVAESLNTGNPGIFPPDSIGLDRPSSPQGREGGGCRDGSE
jgi:hypothetical protein